MKYLPYILLIFCVGCGSQMKILDGKVGNHYYEDGRYYVKYGVLVQKAKSMRVLYYYKNKQQWVRFGYISEFNIKEQSDPILVTDQLYFSKPVQLMVVCIAQDNHINKQGIKTTTTKIFSLDLIKLFDGKKRPLERRLQQMQTLRQRKVQAAKYRSE